MGRGRRRFDQEEASDLDWRQKRREQNQDNKDLVVDCYLLELTLKQSFDKDKRKDGVPDLPILCIHHLSPSHYVPEKPGQDRKPGEDRVIQICEHKKFVYDEVMKQIRVNNIEEMKTFWPCMSKNFKSNHRFWMYQLCKHGSKAATFFDFLDEALKLGKDYIIRIQQFLKKFGYANSGIYNCKEFQDDLTRNFGYHTHAVYTWGPTTEPPKIVTLSNIQFLLTLELIQRNYNRPQESLGDLSAYFFELKLPRSMEDPFDLEELLKDGP